MNTSLISRMADRRHMDAQTFYDTVKETLVPSNTTKEQLAAFLMVADRYGLDPLTKEIYAFPNRKGTGITPVVSIDGWINLVNSHPQCDGFTIDYNKDDQNRLVSATCKIHRKDRSHPVEVTEFYSECYRNTEPWNQMPGRMLRHKAFKEAARLAFGFAGITDEDEARDIGNRPVMLERVADNVVNALDDFAAVVNSAEPQTTASNIPVDSGAGGSIDIPSTLGVAADRTEAIDKLLALAVDPHTTPEEKLETLDQLQPAYADVYGLPWTATALQTSAKVIKGELKAAAAKKYMGSLAKEPAP